MACSGEPPAHCLAAPRQLVILTCRACSGQRVRPSDNHLHESTVDRSFWSSHRADHLMHRPPNAHRRHRVGHEWPQ
eukprot:scaffold58722_cov31-Tisochrysis_lutea.AAC.2